MASSSSSHRAFSDIQPDGIRRTAEGSSRIFDVFINHRGSDCKDTLAMQLYNLLKELGIRAFLDSEEKELGVSFPSTIEIAIHSASAHVAIFSKRYAESAWCLAELLLMLQSRSKIIPVFYGVKPSDLRYIEKGVYADAFAKYEEKGRYTQKLNEWKESLHSISFTAGYEINNFNVGDCKIIVSALQKEIERKKRLYVAKYPVGLHKLVEYFRRRCLNELVQDFDNQCKMNKNNQGKVQIVGIFGMGGVGKTTLSKELFNRKRSQYSRACFLFDVREFSTKSNLPYLQMKLLRDIFHEDQLNFQSREEGTSCIWNSIERSNFLSFILVLDDVDQLEQLDALLIMDILNKSVNSLIIITTRDVGVLRSAGVKDRYHLKGMDKDDVRELFCWHAFRQPHPASGYEELVEAFLGVCGGLPLSLQVLGSHVHGRDKDSWRFEVKKVTGPLHRDIKQKLKISFDALGSQEKQIFMDIACFFDNEFKCIAMRIWKESGWSAEYVLKTLKEKSLVEEIEDTMPVLRMHQHLRDLGREMADELSYPRRLWHPRDLKSSESKGFKKILTQTKGRCFHSIFDKFLNSKITFFLGEPDDRAKRSSFLLWLHVEYPEYLDDGLDNDLNSSTEPSIPFWIPLQNLQFLKISNGYFERLWQRDVQAPLQLKALEIHGTFLERFPDFFGILTDWEKDDKQMVIEGWPLLGSLSTDLQALDLNDVGKSVTVKTPLSFLEDLVICDQENIIEIIINGNYFPNLQSFNLSGMKNLIELKLTRIETLNCLNVTNCKDLKRLSGTSGLTNLVELNIRACLEIEELSLGHLGCLERITIVYCKNLNSVSGISDLIKLVELKIFLCRKLQLELCLVDLNCLKRITLDESVKLECLELNGCKSLKTVSGMYNLKKLQLVNILDCPELEELSLVFLGARSLQRITIDGCGKHNCLDLSYCKNLKSLSVNFHLTELNICKCPELEDVNLGLLCCLETIKIVCCRDLRSVSGISDLTKLVELNISFCWKLHLELCLVDLNCLQSIKLDESVRLECFELNGCKSLKTVSGTYALQKLQFVNIRNCPELEELPVFFGPSYLQRITIDGCWKLGYLELRNCQNLKTLSGDFDLVELSITECLEIEELSLGHLGSLKRITIVYCKNLKCVSGIPDLTNLVELKISRCWKLQLDLCLVGLNHLKRISLDESVKLECLKLNCCKSLKTVSGMYNLKKLQSVKIRDCPELEELPPVFLGANCLQKITIDKCKKHDYLEFSDCQILKSLSVNFNLVELNIRKCTELEDVNLGLLCCLETIKIVHCRHLKSVSGISDLKKLVELNISLCWKLQLELCLVGLNCLKSITLDESVTLDCFELNGCRSLKTVLGKCDLQKLQFVTIRDCPELEELPIFCRASCLKRITIKGCEKLNLLNLNEFLCLKSVSGNFDLVELVTGGCSELEELRLDSQSCLERLTINYCTGLKSVSGIFDLTKLVELNISQCWKLQIELRLVALNCLKRIKVDKSVKLKCFELKGCQSLKAVSGTYDLENVQLINICDCPELEELPFFYGPSWLQSIVIHGCGKLRSLCLRRLSCLVRITIDGCGKLGYLELRDCENLKEVSGNFDGVSLSISDCPMLEELRCFDSLTCFEDIHIFRCQKLQNITLPSSLNYLELNGFRQFQSVPGISALTNLVELNISECWELQQLSVAHLSLLEKLTIANLKCIISGISNLAKLVELNISHCWELELELCLSGLNCLKRVSFVECGKIHTITLPTSLIKLTLQGCRDLKTVAGVSTLAQLAKLVITSCPQLKNITLPTTLVKLTVQQCIELLTVAAISDMTKLTEMNISQCPQLEELPSVAGLNCLERITINNCEKLENIAGIGELHALEGMQLLYSSSAAMLNCIPRLKSVPSNFMHVIGKAVDGAESILNPQFFSGAIDTDAVIELDRVQSSDRHPKGSLSAIIICCVVVVNSSTPLDKINESLRGVSENSLLSFEVCHGEWIITMICKFFKTVTSFLCSSCTQLCFCKARLAFMASSSSSSSSFSSHRAFSEIELTA
ncbi:hypothetical protein SUGI_0677200 [Cryptomeria japonica]|nr:hypothetical protein SUGI_0677200 [Cryptomeria japonica]